MSGVTQPVCCRLAPLQVENFLVGFGRIGKLRIMVLPVHHTRIGLWLAWVILLSLVVLGCAPGVVVVDGDTVRLSNGDRVRYIGIDTPEIGEPYYEEARSANRRLVEGEKIRLEEDINDEDTFGRLLRYVYADGTFVNAELARQGYALVYRQDRFPENKYYDILEEAADEAAANGRGIWSMDPPHPKLQEHPEDYYLP
jgi:endonuclease YncB( thermonuclease family)